MENFRLKVFRAVAHSLNFRVAAEELLLTQPAVSQQVKALEAELSTALFSRVGGRVSLTPAGLALLPYAERLKKTADDAREAVLAVSGSGAGESWRSAPRRPSASTCSPGCWLAFLNATRG